MKNIEQNELEQIISLPKNTWILVPTYMSDIAYVEDKSISNRKEDPKIWKIDLTTLMTYSYLWTFGKTCGWGKIYPNQDEIAKYCKVSQPVISKRISLLEEIGLLRIYTQPVFKNGYWVDSNSYHILKPKHVNNRLWYNYDKQMLRGPMYNFSYQVFLSNGKEDKHDKFVSDLSQQEWKANQYDKDNNSVTFKIKNGKLDGDIQSAIELLQNTLEQSKEGDE